MNIFYLDSHPGKCSEYLCDIHLRKMLIETAQILSTAIRVLDGTEYIDDSSGRKIRRWKMDNTYLENRLYKASHVNHPCCIWARKSFCNYIWLAEYYRCLCQEYQMRFQKSHKTIENFVGFDFFNLHVPNNIPKEPRTFTSPPFAMPTKYVKENDVVESYRDYYVGEKSSFAKWTNIKIPDWYKDKLNNASVCV